MANWLNALVRKKPIEKTPLTATRLERCLSTLDLTMLGIGSTLGLGVYILAGQVASVKAGPAVTVSFFIAAVASVFAGLCYAEFGARVPKSGSAYVYSYITVGEFMAFIIGWNLILEYAIGSASIARGYSGYVDSLVDNKIQTNFKEWAPLNFGTSEYFDFFAFFIAILIAGLLSIGVKKSTNLNAVFTVMNVLGVIYAIICGAFKLNWYNWNIPKSDLPHDTDKIKHGDGGFMPFGFSGLMAGAATCFYGFIGFDMIATTGEEVKNPSKSIPLSIVYSLLVIFVCYCGVSAIQTLMWPYYDQNQLAPLPYVFKQVGYPFAGYILTVGAMAGLYSSLMGTMYPLTRVLYSMGTDRVIFGFFSQVNRKLKTPHWATIFAGIFSGLMAAMFEFQQLADMMSIGTLLAYALVSISVLILRYQKRSFIKEMNNSVINNEDNNRDDTQLLITPNNSLFRRIFNLDNELVLTAQTSQISTIVAILAALVGFLPEQLYSLNPYALTSVFFTLIILIVFMVALRRQPQTDEKMSFKIPGVPLIPVLSVFVNIYLMIHLSKLTWIRFGVWMFLGMLMYFFYGVIESVGHLSDDEKKIRMRQERTSSTTSTLSRKSNISNHNSCVDENCMNNESSDQNSGQTSNCDNNDIQSQPIDENNQKLRFNPKISDTNSDATNQLIENMSAEECEDNSVKV